MVLRFIKIMCIFALLGLLIASCSIYSGGKDSKGKYEGSLSDPSIYESSRMYGSNEPGSIVIHNNTKLRYSRELSGMLANVPGVRSAIVMLTEKNAYAAILIDDSVNGTLGTKSKQETNNAGTSIGTYDPDTLNQSVENWRLATGINNYRTVQNHEGISAPFKQKIATTLRAANPLIYEVFISANRDFVNQLNAYAIESGWGEKTLESRINAFNGTANRLFGIPEAALRK
jgi:hypothetical protein